jgi:hypothetical protein
MTVSTMHPETITVRRVTATTETDDNGVPVVNVEEVPIVGVSIEPLAGGGESATLDDGDAVEAYRVSTSVVADWVSENDTCTWGATTYVVNRPPRTYRRFLPHTEFTIIAVRG